MNFQVVRSSEIVVMIIALVTYRYTLGREITTLHSQDVIFYAEVIMLFRSAYCLQISEQIVVHSNISQHQYLSVTVSPGTNTDGWNEEPEISLPVFRESFQHDRENTCLLQR